MYLLSLGFAAWIEGLGELVASFLVRVILKSAWEIGVGMDIKEWKWKLIDLYRF